MQDADAIVAYSREQIAAHGLEVEEVRDAVVAETVMVSDEEPGRWAEFDRQKSI